MRIPQVQSYLYDVVVTVHVKMLKIAFKTMSSTSMVDSWNHP